MYLSPQVKSLLVKQRYHLVGRHEHAAVKKCHWLHKALTEDKLCYKSWYGIQSHRCVQFTPMLSCPNACLHCWRIERSDPGVSWDELRLPPIDKPETLIEGALKEQRRIVSGYKSNPKVDRKRFEEALHPRHFAISLAGEPTLYPYIDDLLGLLRSKGFTSFLVTNGLYPEVLSSLSNEPSQLYVSINAPNETLYRKVCRPSMSDAWQRLNETLSLLSTFKCPTALRLTLIKGVNDVDIEGYASLIEKANSHYVEVKAYMYLGFSRYRLKLGNMPRHSEVVRFAHLLSQHIGYEVLEDSLHSRVVLLSRLPKPIEVA
ncbi:MAG: 4-demethylwyosine synthase TYW1 [Thermoprotei archaeon]|nr:MAG: 4-demethylwyosine synthase TYW1 [Thermoprotei archaeon]